MARAKALNAAEMRLQACTGRLQELQGMFDNQMAEKKRIEDGAMALQRKMNQVTSGRLLFFACCSHSLWVGLRSYSPVLFVMPRPRTRQASTKSCFDTSTFRLTSFRQS